MKNHVVTFNINGRELKIETDNLQDVFNAAGVTTPPGKSSVEEDAFQKSVNENAIAYRDLAIEQQKTIRKLQEQVVKYEAQESVVAGTRQPGGMQHQQTVRPDAQSQAQMMRRAPQASRLPVASAVDFPPDKMNQEIWNGMSPEDQQLWMQRWQPQ